MQPDSEVRNADDEVPDDAVPVCHHCFTPQPHNAIFCDECGMSVGPYNNSMPFERIAALGEVLRSGVGPEARFAPLRTLGYIFVGLWNNSILAPLYFLRLYRNYQNRQNDLASGTDRDEAETPDKEGEHG